jgi:hypothetical protein
VGGTGISGEVLIGRKRRWRTKARKNKDVRILREDDLGEVRYRYQVTDCYSDDGCLELVELTRAGRRWRQEVRQRLDRKELERAMANPLGRPLTSWGVY